MQRILVTAEVILKFPWRIWAQKMKIVSSRQFCTVCTDGQMGIFIFLAPFGAQNPFILL